MAQLKLFEATIYFGGTQTPAKTSIHAESQDRAKSLLRSQYPGAADIRVSPK